MKHLALLAAALSLAACATEVQRNPVTSRSVSQYRSTDYIAFARCVDQRMFPTIVAKVDEYPALHSVVLDTGPYDRDGAAELRIVISQLDGGIVRAEVMQGHTLFSGPVERARDDYLSQMLPLCQDGQR